MLIRFEQLDALGCDNPNCADPNCGKGEFHIYPTCHPRAGVSASHVKGIPQLKLACHKCGKEIFTLDLSEPTPTGGIPSFLRPS